MATLLNGIKSFFCPSRYCLRIITTSADVRYIANCYRQYGVVRLIHTGDKNGAKKYQSFAEARKDANAIATRGGYNRNDYVRRVETIICTV